MALQVSLALSEFFSVSLSLSGFFFVILLLSAAIWSLVCSLVLAVALRCSLDLSWSLWGSVWLPGVLQVSPGLSGLPRSLWFSLAFSMAIGFCISLYLFFSVLVCPFVERLADATSVGYAAFGGDSRAVRNELASGVRSISATASECFCMD